MYGDLQALSEILRKHTYFNHAIAKGAVLRTRPDTLAGNGWVDFKVLSENPYTLKK